MTLDTLSASHEADPIGARGSFSRHRPRCAAAEIDWWENPPRDLTDQIAGDPNITVVSHFATANGIMTFNHRYPPFDNPAIRRALLGAVRTAGPRSHTTLCSNHRSLVSGHTSQRSRITSRAIAFENRRISTKSCPSGRRRPPKGAAAWGKQPVGCALLCRKSLQRALPPTQPARAENLPNETHFHIGAFRDAARLRPTRHIFREERLPWLLGDA